MCGGTQYLWIKQYSGKENVVSVVQLKINIFQYTWFQVISPSWKIIRGLIKQSNNWWYKQQQQFCWAEDLFKPQIKDKNTWSIYGNKTQWKYGNKINFQSRLVKLEQWDTTTDLFEWSNTKIWQTNYWQRWGTTGTLIHC